MNRCSNRLQLDICSGYTVKGKSHLRTKQPNQDSFLIGLLPYCDVFVVADGVGSHLYSQRGSKYVCRAVKKTFKMLLNNKIKEEEILSNIYQIYRKQIRKKEQHNVGTTCLFGAVCDEKLYIGQAGDGVCCVKLNSKFKMTAKKDNDFTNEVLAISDKSEYESWKFRTIDLKDIEELEIMLTTDGISEDIIPDKMSDFMSYVMSKVVENKKRGLKKLLTEWSFPGSIDDKTIVIARWKR